MAVHKFDQEKIADVVGRRPNYYATGEHTAFAAPHLLTGVEIELEDWVNPPDGIGAIGHCWDEHDEGSLRNGREFVLNPPRNGADLEQAIDAFFNAEAKWNPSERASVHVHLDMLTDSTVGEFRALFTLAYAMEGAIYRVADENRKWTSYSCPLTDMRASRMVAILNATTYAGLKRGLAGEYHEEKYYGFNAVSLCKHGTIELRYFPCTTNKATLISWINMCQELYMAAKGQNVLSVVQKLHEIGPEAFVREHFKMSAGDLLAYLDVDEVLRRADECAAIYEDAHALKPYKHMLVDAGLKSEAYHKMFNKVCAPIAVIQAKKKELDAVEVNVDALYDALLQAAKINHNKVAGV